MRGLIKFNKSSSTISIVIIWLGIIFCTILIIIYGIPKIGSKQTDLEDITQDINKLQTVLNKACISKTIIIEYNPNILEGKIIFNPSSICINSTFYLCRDIQCKFINTTREYDVKDLIYLTIEKDLNKISIGKI